MTKIIGIGNALVDIMINLPDDSALEHFRLPKGSMQHVDRKAVDEVLDYTKDFRKVISSGGSAANAIHGLASLGNQVAFIAKVGRDEFGDFFYNDMVLKSIEPKFLRCDTETGIAIGLISPDSERTFAVFLGAAIELDANDLSDDLFVGYDILHIEGYLVQNHKLIETAVKMAKRNGLMVSLDMASYNVVEDNLDFLKRIVKDHIDIVFANEHEALAFTGLGPTEALRVFASQSEIAVVKIGDKGSLIQQGENVCHIDVIPANVIDTTGAGDVYASGFLHGMIRGLPFDRCGKIGALLAGNVIEHMGAKIPEDRWEYLKAKIAEI